LEKMHTPEPDNRSSFLAKIIRTVEDFLVVHEVCPVLRQDTVYAVRWHVRYVVPRMKRRVNIIAQNHNDYDRL
jgi:hypothetical protein